MYVKNKTWIDKDYKSDEIVSDFSLFPKFLQLAYLPKFYLVITSWGPLYGVIECLCTISILPHPIAMVPNLEIELEENQVISYILKTLLEIVFFPGIKLQSQMSC